MLGRFNKIIIELAEYTIILLDSARAVCGKATNCFGRFNKIIMGAVPPLLSY